MMEPEEQRTDVEDDRQICMATERTSLATERTFLANERTFLAWFRTAETLIALGVAIAQFLTRDVVDGFSLTRFMAILLVLLGAFIVVEGLFRYRRTVREIRAGCYRPSHVSVVVTTAVLFLVAVVAVVWVLTVR